jgi:hypothetical protein
MPNLSSFLPNDSPGVPLGTMKALMPLCFLDLSVVANTTKPSACQLQGKIYVVVFFWGWIVDLYFHNKHKKHLT